MMLEIEDRGRHPLPGLGSPIEFFSVEIAPMPGGTLSVSVTATIFDDEDLQLINQDIARAPVATIDEALALIRAQVLPRLPDSLTQKTEY
jgi:hypothetical protein